MSPGSAAASQDQIHFYRCTWVCSGVCTEVCTEVCSCVYRSTKVSHVWVCTSEHSCSLGCALSSGLRCPQGHRCALPCCAGTHGVTLCCGITLPGHAVPGHAVPGHTTSCQVTSSYTMPFHSMPPSTMPRPTAKLCQPHGL